MCPEGIRKSRESSTVPVCVSPVFTPSSFTCVTTTSTVRLSTKLASTHLAKFTPSLDVNPSRCHLPRIRLPVKAFPARHCQKSPISPRHLGRRNTLVNVPLTLHTDAQLPWYENSLVTSVPLVSTFFVANGPDLEASCIQRFCMSTSFALPSPLRLTRHIVAEAYSVCRIFPSPSPRFGSRALLRPS